jgi:hypothetical protein
MSTLECPGYHPNSSGLVLSGIAETRWTRGKFTGFDVETSVRETADMVELDWKRSVLAGAFGQCLRSRYEGIFLPNVRIVSFERAGVVGLAPRAREYRMLLERTTAGTKNRFVFDFVLLARSRTEIVLIGIGAAAPSQSVSSATLRLAQILASRVEA